VGSASVQQLRLGSFSRSFPLQGSPLAAAFADRRIFLPFDSADQPKSMKYGVPFASLAARGLVSLILHPSRDRRFRGERRPAPITSCVALLRSLHASRRLFAA